MVLTLFLSSCTSKIKSERGNVMAGKRSRPYTKEDVAFVYENYAKMTSAEIASELGISKFQVSKIVSELRKHTDFPKKTARRPNPVLQFIEEKGLPKKKKKATTKRKK